MRTMAPASTSETASGCRVGAPVVWSQPWERLRLDDRSGYIGIARAADTTRPDRYWCGDADPAGFCTALQSWWLDETTNPSCIAVYPTSTAVTAAWLTTQQDRLTAGLPAHPYRIEPMPLGALRDWTTVPARTPSPLD
jgi:hypothetical protein